MVRSMMAQQIAGSANKAMFPDGEVPAGTISGRLHMFEGHHKGVDPLIERIGLAAEDLRGPARHGHVDAVERLRSALTELQSYAEVHFAQEEKLMEDVLYPQRDHHVARHRAFLSWMDRVQAVVQGAPYRLRATSPGVVLAGWWEAHARGQDRALTEFLCRGGI